MSRRRTSSSSPARARCRSSTTLQRLSGCAVRMSPRSGRPPSAPARCCSAPPASCRAGVRRATGPSGIDMALTLAGFEAGEDEARALQLIIEYDPHPPFDSGSLEKVDSDTLERATEILAGGVNQPVS